MSVAATYSYSSLSSTISAAYGGKAQDRLPSQAEARAQLNVSIVTVSMEVSIGAQNEPLALLYRSAIDHLNEALREYFGPNAIENAAAQDNTPEGTAGRIVSLSTGFFEAFKRQHPGEDEVEVLKKFMHTIREGMERGFREAREILQGLGVLGGDIAASIDKTYELVQKGYAEFEAAHMARLSPTAQDTAA